MFSKTLSVILVVYFLFEFTFYPKSARYGAYHGENYYNCGSGVRSKRTDSHCRKGGQEKFFRDDYHYIEAVEGFYKIHTTLVTFSDAKRVCELEGASVYSADNSFEAQTVLEYWKSTESSSSWSVFYGLTKSNGVFKNMDGKPISEVYSNWDSGEPNNRVGNEDCVELYRHGTFNDLECDWAHRFICKKTLKSLEWNYDCIKTDFGIQSDKKFFRKDYKYIEEVDSFYKIHTTPTNWRDAKRECAQEGASLFYPENKEEANAVIAFWKLCQKYTKPSNVWVFVGISDIITKGAFETIDGKPITELYSHWKLNQPDNGIVEDCLHLNQEGQLKDIKCDAKYSFICKKTPPAERVCSSDIHKSTLGAHDGKKFFRDDYNYIKSEESFYKIHTSPRTFANAKRVCELEGASLFYPENDDEAHAVIEFWNKTHPSADWTVFVGLTDFMIEGLFETIDGRPISEVYNNWRHGEPNSHGGEEDCVELYKQGYINDKSCDAKFRFICKKSLKTLEWNHNCNMSDLDYTFVKNIGKCYKLHSTPLNWMEAHAVCRAEQSYLAMINNQLEADYLVDLTESAPKPRVGGSFQRGIYHMGFHNKLNKGWQTVRGTPIIYDADAWWDVYAATDDEDMQCGSMFFNGRLNTVDCATNSFFICEHEID